MNKKVQKDNFQQDTEMKNVRNKKFWNKVLCFLTFIGYEYHLIWLKLLKEGSTHEQANNYFIYILVPL